MPNLTTVDVTPDALDAAGRALATTSPIHMVNLVRYRAQADYGGRTEFAPCSGREAYTQRYAPAFNKVAGEVAPGEKITVAFLGDVHATVVAPAGEGWDGVVVVEYPSFAVLRRILDSPAYAADAEPHRLAALADWRFLATTKVALPGDPT